MVPVCACHISWIATSGYFFVLCAHTKSINKAIHRMMFCVHMRSLFSDVFGDCSWFSHFSRHGSSYEFQGWNQASYKSSYEVQIKL